MTSGVESPRQDDVQYGASLDTSFFVQSGECDHEVNHFRGVFGRKNDEEAGSDQPLNLTMVAF